MARYSIEDVTLTNIANAIRSKTNKTDLMAVSDMADEISDIPVGSGGGNTDVEDSLVTRTITTYTNDRVTTIRNCAFAYCYSLTSINFPQCISIGSSAFAYCSSLTTANFSSQCSSIGVKSSLYF